MSHRVCPWWLGYLLLSPVRRWMQGDPEKLLRPYVREGMTVLEPGPGMGFYTIPLARLVGTTGRVIAVDIQPKMIERLKRRAAKANVLERISARVVPANTMGIEDLSGEIDFTLAFAVVHEFPDARQFFSQVARASKTRSQLLFAEPSGHVNSAAFDGELAAASAAGFSLRDRLAIPRTRAALLTRN